MLKKCVAVAMDSADNSMNGGELVEGDLTYAVIGCAQKVHGVLRCGLPEYVYHRALMHELAEAGIPAESEVACNVVYDGIVCGEFRADIVVDRKVIIELKAVEKFARQDEAQLLKYLRVSGCRVGLLLNFGDTSLRQRRLVL
jgi:GxxExxY protein